MMNLKKANALHKLFFQAIAVVCMPKIEFEDALKIIQAIDKAAFTEIAGMPLFAQDRAALEIANNVWDAIGFKLKGIKRHTAVDYRLALDKIVYAAREAFFTEPEDLGGSNGCGTL